MSPVSVEEIAALLHRAGLVEAFGHVSVRPTKTPGLVAGRITEMSPGLVAGRITTTAPLLAASTVALHGPDDPARPLEAPLHRAIYAARPDVGAICRTHSPAAVAWGVRGVVPPLLHGLGAMAGEVGFHGDPQLVTDDERAAAAAAALGPEGACLLLRANGALAVGADLPEAAVRAWYLEERCRVALEAGAGGRPLEGQELAERIVHTPAEQRRAWAWLQARFGDG